MRSDQCRSGLGDAHASDWPRFWLGDHNYFDRLVRRESPVLRSVVARYFHDRDVAEEMLQETWATIFLKRGAFRGTGTLRGWMASVARRVCLLELRRTATRWKYRDEETQPAGWASPLEAVQRDDVRTAISTALREIPERQQCVVLLRLLQGLSTKETARMLGCPEGTVQASLHRARKALQRRLQAIGSRC